MRWDIASATALIAVTGPAHAVQYLTIEQAQTALFPAAATFRSQESLLTDPQREQAAKASGVRVREARVRMWVALDGQGKELGRMLLDEVTGKHDLITYAIGVGVDGRIVDVEILDYRENYGGQIREPAWRAQFHGKSARDPLKIDADIANISGATLSSSHVTDGIRKLLAIDAVLRSSAKVG